MSCIKPKGRQSWDIGASVLSGRTLQSCNYEVWNVCLSDHVHPILPQICHPQAVGTFSLLPFGDSSQIVPFQAPSNHYCGSPCSFSIHDALLSSDLLDVGVTFTLFLVSFHFLGQGTSQN